MAKRGENIYKRKDGRYEGRFIKGRKLDGKPVFGYVYARTYTKIKHLLILKKNMARQDEAVRIIGKGTLEEFMWYWLETVVKDRIKLSTYAQYHERIEKYIIPALGKTPMSRLNDKQVQDFIDSLSQKGFASSTVTNMARLLRSAVKTAQQLGVICTDPCCGLSLPKAQIKERRALERNEQIALEQAVKGSGESIELAVFLSLYAGLRIGEICALRWKDIDFSTGMLTVRGTLQRLKCFDGMQKTMLSEGTPKSRRSLRCIPMPEGLTDRLRRYGLAMPGDCFVLTGTAKPPEPRTLRAQFKRVAEKSGLMIPFHTLRHTFATRCLEYNFDIQTLSEILGHANASTTMNIYAHSVLEHKKTLTRRIHILSENNAPSDKPSGSY